MYGGNVDLEPLLWPVSGLGVAIEYLANRSGLSAQSSAKIPAVPENLGQVDEETLGRWIEYVANQLGLEAEPTQTSYAEAEQLARGAGPALLRLPASLGADEPRFLVLLKGGWLYLSLVGTDLSVRRVEPGVVRDALCAEVEAPHVGSIDQFLTRAGVPEHRQARARRAILDEQLGPVQIRGCWLLRLSSGANLWLQMRRAHLPHILLMHIGGQVAQLSLIIVAWWIIGGSALAGHFDLGWFLGWALVLLTAVAFQILSTEAQSDLVSSAGVLFKQRLLYGTLQLEVEEIRHQGAGQFLGRVMASEAVELLALGGGFVAVLAVLQLGMATAILALGVGGWPQALLLLFWLAVTLVLGWRYMHRSQDWGNAYREMTNDLVERMVGHRTRLAQEDSAHWHDEEDQALDRYMRLSEKLDRSGMFLQAFVPRGWAVVGLAGICSTLLVTPDSPNSLAVSLGGMLLALQALTGLVMGVQSIVGVTMAWKEVSPLFQAAARSEEPPSQQVVPLATRQRAPAESMPVLTARGLNFRYRDQGRQVLRECGLQIQHGDRLLLEGPSGGGKSTFAAILAGLRMPESGILLLRGYDRQTIGAAEWRRRVVVVPQFHENHVFTGTFAFNLLMGRRWPAFPEDLAEAEELCRELGLGDLLDRMPSGMQQMIGESGWQVSHGERSRLYVARALLQQADIIIFDESFGALDPENLQRALRCVQQRTPTLLVIAHP